MLSNSLNAGAAAAILWLLAVSPVAYSQSNQAVWVGPEIGEWQDPTNWSTGLVPDESDWVVIDGNTGQASQVTVGDNFSVDFLTIDNGDQIRIASSNDLFSQQQVDVAGAILIESNAQFTVGGPLFLQPESTVSLLGGQGSSRLIANIGNSSLVWNQGLIEGAGLVVAGRNFINDGQVVSNHAGSNLELSLSQTIRGLTTGYNRGVMRAEQGGLLVINALSGNSPTTLLNSFAGTEGVIEALPGSQVTIERMRIDGGIVRGVLDSESTGLFDLVQDATLANLTVEGQVRSFRGFLAGRIQNNGSILAAQTLWVSNEGVELTGGGVVQLGLSPQAAPGILSLNSSSNPVQLVNEDNTIRGHGIIDLGFSGSALNRGTIEAVGIDELPLNATSRQLEIRSGNSMQVPLTNAGLIQANTGTLLRLTVDQILNHEGATPGTIHAAPGGVVRLNSQMSITGGILSAAAGSGDPEMPGPGIIVAQSSNPGAVLFDLRLEGAIGTEDSSFGLSGEIENTGSLEVRELRYGDGLVLSGGGELLVGRTGGNVYELDGAFFNQAARITNRDNTLRLFDASILPNAPGLELHNFGTLQNEPDTFSTIEQASVLNGGTIRAEADSQLTIRGQVVADSPEAEIHAGAGAMVVLDSVVGGVITTAPGVEGVSDAGRVQVRSGSPSEPGLTDVHIAGNVEVQQAGLEGRIVNDGEVQLLGSVSPVGPLTTLEGTGTMHVVNSLGIVTTTGAVLINEPSHTLAGPGTLFINQGALLVNRGTIHGLRIQGQRGSFVNTGSVRADQQAPVVIGGDFGGPEGFINQGQIDVLGGEFRYDSGTLINAAGATISNNDTLYAAGVENRVGGLVEGDGFVLLDPARAGDGVFTNAGRVSPGNLVYGLNIRGEYEQTATGVLEIVVDGFDMGGYFGDEGNLEHGILVVEQECCGGARSEARLAGELRFDFDETLVPQLGDDVTFLMALPIGQFDSITGLPELDPSLSWAIVYEAEQASAEVVIAGDYNADGLVDAVDYAVWRDSFGILYDQSHYEVWKNNFGATAPALALASVPEPSAVLLLLVASAIVLNGRFRASLVDP